MKCPFCGETDIKVVELAELGDRRGDTAAP